MFVCGYVEQFHLWIPHLLLVYENIDTNLTDRDWLMGVFLYNFGCRVLLLKLEYC